MLVIPAIYSDDYSLASMDVEDKAVCGMLSVVLELPCAEDEVVLQRASGKPVKNKNICKELRVNVISIVSKSLSWAL